MNILRIMMGVLVSTGITACSLWPWEQVDCPPVSVAEDATRAHIEGIRYGQLAYIRVNGVWPECKETQDGYDMEIQVGFLMQRDLSESATTEEVPLDITFAFVDENDAVVSRTVHSDRVFFGQFNDRSNPVLIINLDVPAGTRVVFGIGKAIEE